MGFNLFGKKKEEGKFVDRAYISETGKMNACLELAKSDPSTVFITWFPETERNFKSFFEQHGIQESRVLNTKHLHGSMLENKIAVFAEHYPLHQKELDLVENWKQQQFIVFSSLDEPLFKHFGSEKMLPLMKLLGMKENVAVEHPLVTKSIVRGQEKIASKVSFEQSTNSQQDWLTKNLV